MRDATERRLEELEREWDIERAIETEAPLVILAGAALAALAGRKYLALPAFAAGMLLVHTLHGWYPLIPVFRALGVRSSREIGDEIHALKTARGDFSGLSAGDPAERARRAYRAAAPRPGERP
jgi:hypothetical protein